MEQTNSNKTTWLRMLLHSVIYVACFASFTIVSLGTPAAGYEWLSLLPVAFAASYALVLAPSLKQELRVFNLVLTLMQFLRFVIMPMFLVYANYYGGRSPVAPLPETIQNATLLMVYELAILSLTIFILDQRIKRKPKRVQAKLTKRPQNGIYFLLFAVSIVSLLAFPSVIRKIGFFMPGAGGSTESASLLTAMVGFLFMVAKQLFFLIVIWYCHQKYETTGKNRFVWFAALAVFVNIGIFMGTNRADIVITAIASILIFRQLFPHFFKHLFFGVCLIIPTMLSAIATFRKISSISDGGSKLIDYTDKLQVYLAGPYNVAIALETKHLFPEAGNLGVFFYDIFRPMIGIGSFIADWPIKYSSLYFNERYFFSDHMTQIIPMVGQGNLFFGPIFAPILGAAVICFAYYLHSKKLQSQNIEIYYILTLACARLGLMAGQNLTILINDLSFNLSLFLIVYWLNKKIVFTRQSRHQMVTNRGES
ncbi:hypothetical protein HBP99_11610 [Listeria booriae]|uniref:hypothetical protein n=1 Tax=Listeria booriae TaxID=1552123 RepID=UPI001626FF35|nr:hypothetical protein [Listeria booriae]MBC2369286.1 hypothetical protein [Listeria booriae]